MYVMMFTSTSYIKEAHELGFAGYFGRDKILILIKEIFFWPKMTKYVERLVKQYWTCRIVKGWA